MCEEMPGKYEYSIPPPQQKRLSTFIETFFDQVVALFKHSALILYVLRWYFRQGRAKPWCPYT